MIFSNFIFRYFQDIYTHYKQYLLVESSSVFNGLNSKDVLQTYHNTYQAVYIKTYQYVNLLILFSNLKILIDNTKSFSISSPYNCILNQNQLKLFHGIHQTK